jgi:hypothetical protein
MPEELPVQFSNLEIYENKKTHGQNGQSGNIGKSGSVKFLRKQKP